MADLRKQYAIDTSSLINICRYYLPLNSVSGSEPEPEPEPAFVKFMHTLFRKKKLLLLERVETECWRVAQGLAYEKLKLKDVTTIKGDGEPPTLEKHEIINADWINKKACEDLNSGEFQGEMEKYIKESADFQLIMYAKKRPHLCGIITEERSTMSEKDKGVMKKSL